MERGYPKREHLKKRKDPFAVIESELQLYPDGKSFREALVGLSRIYGKTTYGKALQEHAIKAGSARVLQTGEYGARDNHSRMWYAGSILGIYARSVNLESPLKGLVVDYRFSLEPQPQENESESSHHARLAELYMQYSDFLADSFNCLSERRQSTLLSAAQRACEGYDGAYEDAFVEGAMASLNFIEHATEDARSRRRPISAHGS